MAVQLLITNGAMPTTAALPKVTTGTSIKTMLQLVLVSGINGRLIEWGISFDGSAAATPIEVECIETGTVAATVTASVAADIGAFGDNGSVAVSTYLTLSTTGTGYTASAEGTITTTRYLDAPQLIAPTAQYVKQFPLGREPRLIGANINRIRVTAAAAVNAYAYMLIEI